MMRHREVSRLQGFSDSFPLKSLTLALVGYWTMDRATMTIYSGGVILVIGTFLLLHLHAWHQRDELGLNQTEQLALRFGAGGHMISTGLGVVS